MVSDLEFSIRFQIKQFFSAAIAKTAERSTTDIYIFVHDIQQVIFKTS